MNIDHSPREWTYFIKYLLLVTLLLAPQQTYAANKTLSACETLTLTPNVTWDNLSLGATSESWSVITASIILWLLEQQIYSLFHFKIHGQSVLKTKQFKNCNINNSAW